MPETFSPQDIEDLKQVHAALVAKKDPRAEKVATLLSANTTPPAPAAPPAPVPAKQPSALAWGGSLIANRLGIGATPEDVSEGAKTLGSDLVGMVKGAPKGVLAMTPLGIAMGARERGQQGADYSQNGTLPPEIAHAAEQKKAGYSLPYRLLTPVAENLGINVSGEEASAAQGSQGGVLGHAAALPVAMAATAGLSKILPAEVASKPLAEPARALAKTVNPPPAEWNSYIKATEEQAGNVVQHAKENGMPLDSQLDYARAAKSAANAGKDYFQKNVLGPVEDVKVQVGQNYKTLGSINKRIVQINKELSPSYVKKESGHVLTAIANEADLVAEKNQLTEALHEGISKHAGIPAEDVAALRQRYGAQYTIADQTLAAVNQRASASGRASEGAPLPTEKSGYIDRAINYARGGREGIADRAFKKVIDQMPANHSPLPAVPSAVPITPRKVRLPAWQALSK